MNHRAPPLNDPVVNRLMRRSHLLGDFLVVAESGGIRQAAASLHLSQSALTRRIQDLESALDATLFERTSRGMSLTPFGHALKHHASVIALTCKYAQGELGDLRDGEAGELRIAAGPAWAYGLVPDALAHMHAAHPKVRATFISQMNDSSLPMLSAGKLDVVLGGLPAERDRDPQIAYESVLRIEHQVFAHKDHPLCSRRKVRAQSLVDMPWVWFVEAIAGRELITRYVQTAGLELPPASVETTSMEFGFRMLQHGRHLMLLPSTLREIAAARGLAPLQMEQSVGHYSAGLMYRPSAMRLKSFLAFRKFVISEASHFQAAHERDAGRQPGARSRTQ